MEQYLDANPHPSGNKSINLLYGTLGKRDKALSIAKDTTNETEFNNWVGAQSAEFKQKYNVREVKYYQWDWEVFKKTMDANSKIPGTIVTPAQPNVFYIGPSIDTVVDKAKKGKEI